MKPKYITKKYAQKRLPIEKKRAEKLWKKVVISQNKLKLQRALTSALEIETSKVQSAFMNQQMILQSMKLLS